MKIIHFWLTFCYLTPDFLVRHKLKYHPHHLDMWYSSTVRFRRNCLPRSSQLWNALLRCSQVDTTWVPSKISTLKACNTSVAPLVLHGVMGAGDHLPSIRWSIRSFTLSFSIKKGTQICLHIKHWNIYNLQHESNEIKRLQLNNHHIKSFNLIRWKLIKFNLAESYKICKN